MANLTVKPLLILTFTTLLCTPPTQRESPLLALVQAEKDFAQASVQRGLKQAFLSHLADSAIVFRPHPVNAKTWFEQIEETPRVLNWYPIYADLAQSGELGYTTGPWEMTDNGPQKRPPAYGHYFSVWKKQEHGEWKVLVDLGIQHAAPTQKIDEDWRPSARKQKSTLRPQSKSELQIEKDKLLQTDRAFSNSSEREGYENALAQYATAETRWYRPNQFPLLGEKAMREYCLNETGTMIWQPSGAEISFSADLGYTIGSYDFNGANVVAQTGYYVRMWKKEEGATWRMVLEVLSPKTETP